MVYFVCNPCQFILSVLSNLLYVSESVSDSKYSVLYSPNLDIISVEKQNMSKRRILKKINDYKNQVKEKE